MTMLMTLLVSGTVTPPTAGGAAVLPAILVGVDAPAEALRDSDVPVSDAGSGEVVLTPCDPVTWYEP